MAATYAKEQPSNYDRLALGNYQPQSLIGEKYEGLLRQIDAETRSRLDNLAKKRKGASITLQRLQDTLQDDEDDEEFTLPTDHAYKMTFALLNGASLLIKADFPNGSPVADGEGGVRVEWKRPGRSVRLVVPSHKDERSYIYHEKGEDYDADYQVTSEHLAHWLDKLVEE